MDVFAHDVSLRVARLNDRMRYAMEFEDLDPTEEEQIMAFVCPQQQVLRWKGLL